MFKFIKLTTNTPENTNLPTFTPYFTPTLFTPRSFTPTFTPTFTPSPLLLYHLPLLHLPIFHLYKRYEKFLHDDYTKEKNFKDFLEFIKETDLFWVILEEESGKFAGFVYLDNLIGNETKLHSAELTTAFDKAFWGEKTHICAKEFFKYAFDTFGFLKIKANIYPQNFRVKTLLKKCGFELEGVLKHETFRNGQPTDVEIYALINNQKSEEK